MSVSSVNSAPSDDDLSTQKASPFKYDLRLEISEKIEGGTIPVAVIFYDLVRRLKAAADADAPVVILTATGKLFHEQKEMASEEFHKDFLVDNVAGKVSKVLVGFKMHSLTKLSDLKHRLMHTFLIPNNLFLRQHSGGFEHGVKTYSFGFLKDDHPDHPDICMLNQRFARIVAEAWKKVDKDEKAKWRKEHPALFYGDSAIKLPISFTKERVSATHENKDRITTTALVVSVPTKYGKLMKALLDIAITNKKLNNLIPFALSKDNPSGYYYVVAHQARFIENHRNIPIMDVPIDANSKPGNKDKILLDMLNAHTAIYRVVHDPTQNKYHVSTTAAKYREVHQWIEKTLEEHKFPFAPRIRSLKYGPTGKTTTMSYSDIFKDTISVASDSYANSTIKSTQGNAWKQRPPLAISYDLNDAAFPYLSPTKKPTPATPSTTSETLDEDTIQSAISVAIKKLEDKHQIEFNNLKREMQQQIEDVNNKMKELVQQMAVQTYQALVQEESPLATKTDHATLQHEMSLISTQLSTIIHLVQNNKTTPQKVVTSDGLPHSPARLSTKRSKPNMTPEKPLRTGPLFPKELSVSSATSDPEEVMEGCED